LRAQQLNKQMPANETGRARQSGVISRLTDQNLALGRPPNDARSHQCTLHPRPLHWANWADLEGGLNDAARELT
jgi:hypothetical protein